MGDRNVGATDSSPRSITDADDYDRRLEELRRQAVPASLPALFTSTATPPPATTRSHDFDPLAHVRELPLRIDVARETRLLTLAEAIDVHAFPPGTGGDELLHRRLAQLESARDDVTVVDPRTRARIERNIATVHVEIDARAAKPPPPNFDPTRANTAELANALRWLSKHPDAEWGPRALEEATLRTPDGVETLIARYEGHPDDQKRVLYRALSLAGDRHGCRVDDTVESLKRRLAAARGAHERDDAAMERAIEASNVYMGLDGKPGTLQDVEAYEAREYLAAMNPGTTTGSVLAAITAAQGGSVEDMREAGARGEMVEGLGGGAARVYETERATPVRSPVRWPVSGFDPLARVNGRRPINYRIAWGRFPETKAPTSVREKYPAGVFFSDRGFPDFGPYVGRTIHVVGLTGNRKHDNRLANIASGFGDSTEAPEGYSWHHVEDGLTMQLVPRDLHDAVRHTGGAALIRERRRTEGPR